jgi:RecJ-like exonuclease
MKHTKNCPVCDGAGEISEDFEVFTGGANTPDGYELDGRTATCWCCRGSGEIGVFDDLPYQYREAILQLAYGTLYTSIHQEVARTYQQNEAAAAMDAERRQWAKLVLEALGWDAEGAVASCYETARKILVAT